MIKTGSLISADRFANLAKQDFAMNIKYFQDTDTLYIEFRKAEIAETRDLDENTLLEVDRNGNIIALTMEHAKQRADIPQFSFEQVAA
jgi:uncharacterized protein YuzE